MRTSQQGVQTGEPERLLQLDSLRGIAALTVLVGHVLLVSPNSESPPWKSTLWFLWFTPAHALFAGGEAVMLFFVLSGFVLSLPFYRGPVDTPKFIIRRLLRIYPAYWCAVTLAFTGRALLGANPGLEGGSRWFNHIWSNSVTPSFVVHQYLLLGSFENGRLIPVVWSLVHEMRISLIFPLLMALLLRWKGRGMAVVGLSLFVGGHLAGFLVRRMVHVRQDYTDTLIYAALFVVGAALARYRVELADLWRRQRRSTKLWAILGALMAYTYTWWALPFDRVLHVGFLPDMAAVVGACSLFLVAALGSLRIQSVLCLHPLTVLGELSYSIYLLHALILVVLVRLAGTALSPAVLLALLVPATVLAAWVIHRVVEQPSIALGRWITTRRSSRTSLHAMPTPATSLCPLALAACVGASPLTSPLGPPDARAAASGLSHEPRHHASS